MTQNDINMLAREIRNLSPNVDPQEADRAAHIAYTYSLQLAEEYNVTDIPIIHNAKVNNGWRARGLCVHWAEDIQKRLNAEDFQTLEMHRAIAEGNELRIDHSTAIISARGETMNDGIVLDPWRTGGLLYWSPTLEDQRYFWEPQQLVLERKYQAKIAREAGSAPR
ncbi:hypothetical protein [Roseobacter denitrificans]